MEVIAHRGCADQYPENTVAAVRRSSRVLGAVEIDVRRCASGELVVFHDESVDSLTDGTGRVADMDWRDLRTLEVRGSGEPIARLGAVLAAVPRGVRIQLELKEPGLAAAVRRAVADASGDVDVSVSSFLPTALEDVNALDWDVPTGFLFEVDPRENLRTAVDIGCDAVHPHYDCCLERNVVAKAHAAGLEVIAWKADTTSGEVAALRAVGVDGVTADRWDVV